LSNDQTTAKKRLHGQIYPQRQVLIEYPAQGGVHRMRGCEVAAEPAVHHDYGALTQFGGVDLIDERIEQCGRSRDGGGSTMTMSETWLNSSCAPE